MVSLKHGVAVRLSAIVVCALMLQPFGTVFAQTPAQKPLTNRDGGGVSPNLVLTLDTSRSMDFQHAPEYDFYIKTGATSSVKVTFPNFQYHWMHPYDPGPGYYDGTFKGIVPSNPYRNSSPAQMLWQMQMRSPDLNTIYYNPERRYDPWIKADGTRMAASPPTAAPFIPTLPMTGVNRTSPAQAVGFANLTLDGATNTVAANTVAWGLASGTVTVATALSDKITWCTAYAAATNAATCSSGTSEKYYPMIYYRLKKSGDYFLDPSNYRNYTFVDINAQVSGEVTTASASGTVTSTSAYTFPKAAARSDCVALTNACTQAEERQNFSNWFTYYRSRMLMAQGAIPEAFKDIEDNKIRLGWGRIHQAAGKTIDGVNTKVLDSGVRDFGGTEASSARGRFISWLRNHPGNTDVGNGTSYTTEGGTPLITSLFSVGAYYKRTDNGGPWSDNPATRSTNSFKTCRRAYNMLVTDGYYNDSTTVVGNYDGSVPSSTVNPLAQNHYTPERPYKDSSSNTLADVALKYWAEDLMGTINDQVVATADDPATWQHLTNYMVGLGVNGVLDPVADWANLKSGSKDWPAPTNAGRIDDLWHAAVNSRGSYYSVKDTKDLTAGIKDALGQALKRELKESGVATASKTLQDGNRKYIPFYKTGDWNGDIQTYTLDSNGLTGAQQWSAESKLPTHGNRKIWTWSTDTSPPSAVPFAWEGMGTSNQSALGAVGSTYASGGTTYNTLVDFLRGDRSKEGDGQPFRARAGVLGDFVNSNPVLIKDSVDMGYRTLATGGSTYAQYLANKKTRTAVLFVGGNDGMLHAFKETIGAVPAEDGVEVFAYVPKTVIPNLSKLSDKAYGTSTLYHQFYVDGPLMETDAYVNAPGATTPSWRNYLLGSLGSGGRAVFALDVTDTSNLNVASTVRWEFSSASNGDLGYVYSPIQVGVLPNGEWVAIFGNGVFSNAGKAVLFVLNLQTGAVTSLDVETASGSNGLGGVGVVRNSSGVITTLYAGDLKGSLWKFDYLATATSRFQVSGGVPFFVATNASGTAQAITQPPVIYDHSKGGKLVAFGTGRLITEEDANSADVQSIYGVWDKGVDTVLRPMERSLVKPRTLTSTTLQGQKYYQLAGDSLDWESASTRGWVIDLDPVVGMRVVYPPQVVSKKLAMFSVISPARSLVACEAAVGSGANLILPVETGLMVSYPLFDTNGDNVINSSDAVVAGYATNADGIDAIVRGTTTCANGVCSTKISIQNTTSQVGGVIQEAVSTLVVKDRVWRRIINPPIK